MTTAQKIAIVGGGIAAVTCARTLTQAGHHVTLLEQASELGGRMATCSTPFGTFDHGAQYFTIRDPRFALALTTTPGMCRPWSANTVRVLDAHGRVAAAGLPARESHWVPSPAMSALVQAWAKPLQDEGKVLLDTQVVSMETDALHPDLWQLRTEGKDGGTHTYSGFDAVVLAIPAPQAQALLQSSRRTTLMAKQMGVSTVAPCWTLMLAFPQAVQPGLTTLGPHWNAARSTHHRVAWLTRESSKPGRSAVERWTVQASAAWSQEHINDDPSRVSAKLLKAFAEVTGIHAQPAHAQIHRWHYAQTQTPLGKPYGWDAKSKVGVCGDWCIGHRVEDAFISGLEMALALA
jgi:renalase